MRSETILAPARTIYRHLREHGRPRLIPGLKKQIAKWMTAARFSGPVRLNIGAGPQVRTQGWLVLDYVSSGWAKFGAQKPDVNFNVSHGIPFRAGAVAAIYTSHFLEHLTWHEGVVFLKECFRVLAPGGVIRIAVPNGDYFARKFLERDLEFFSDPERCYNHWLGNITDTFLWNALGAFSTGRRQFGRHAMLYTEENLKQRLVGAGFAEISARLFEESAFDDFRDEIKFFPNRKLPRTFTDSTLIVEARKP